MLDFSVKVGDKVSKGDVIGHVGSTGLSTACHLHFSAYVNGSGSDPMQFIGWAKDEAKDAKATRTPPTDPLGAATSFSIGACLTDSFFTPAEPKSTSALAASPLP